MTGFALSLWIWEVTNSTTALATLEFLSLLPRIAIALIAGVIVDCFHRKHLMILGDTIAVLSTVAIALLYITDTLTIWHLFITTVFNSGFGELQQLAYSASISSIIPKQQYARAASLGSAMHYGSIIIAPAIAASLYPVIGLSGILLIDLLTFGVAITTLLVVQIPQPSPPNSAQNPAWQEVIFGLRYLFACPSLRALTIATSLFVFAHDIGGVVGTPMILARTENNAQALASIASAAGVGGVTAAVIIGVWGGPQRKINGVLLGMVGAGMSKTIFGLGQNLSVWLPAQFCSSLNFPLMDSTETAIWMAKVPPHIQGRVFAASSLISQIVSAIAVLMAGPLADRVFEPAMQTNSRLIAWFSPLVGTNAGAGMALLYMLTSIGLLLVGLASYTVRSLRQIEEIVPDHTRGTH